MKLKPGDAVRIDYCKQHGRHHLRFGQTGKVVHIWGPKQIAVEYKVCNSYECIATKVTPLKRRKAK